MTAFGLALSILGLLLLLGSLATIILYASGDPVDALLDEHAQPENRGIGGGEILNHYAGSNTDA